MTQRYAAAKKVLFWIHLFRSASHILLVQVSPARSAIESDIDRWLRELRLQANNWPHWKGMVWLLWHRPEFRNLLYFRIEQENHLPSRLLLEIAKRLYARSPTLFIFNKVIGPGLFIEHGFSTVIAARSIGRNCWINQQVTIGSARGEDDCPTIGNNVRIAAGAKVLGNINVGDNVIIGANAVVCKDVPSNCTVVGVPAYIVRRDHQRVKEML